MTRSPALLALATALTGLAVAAGMTWPGVAGVAVGGAHDPEVGPALPARPATAPVTAPVSSPLVEPVGLLRTWDARRARAWARGATGELRRLYTPASVAGSRDVAMLRAWTARGLEVRRLRTQLLSVQTQRHSPSAWTLLVTDRLSGGVAVGNGIRRPLPRDQATTRTVRLRLVGGVWRVASVSGEVAP